MKASMKSEIIKAYAELLKKNKTTTKISMLELGNVTGVTAPTLYHYFEGKEEIHDATLDYISEELLAVIANPIPSSFPTEYKLQIRIAGLIEAVIKNSLFLDLIFDHMSATEKKKSVGTKNLDAFFHDFTSFVKEWLDSKKSKQQALKIFYLLISILYTEVSCRKADDKSGAISEKVYAILEKII